MKVDISKSVRMTKLPGFNDDNFVSVFHQGKEIGFVSKIRLTKLLHFFASRKEKKVKEIIARLREKDSYITMRDLKYFFSRSALILLKCSENEFSDFTSPKIPPARVLCKRGEFDSSIYKTIEYLSNILNDIKLPKTLPVSLTNKQSDSVFIGNLRKFLDIDGDFLETNNSSKIISNFKEKIAEAGVLLINSNNASALGRIPVQINASNFDGLSLTKNNNSAIYLRNKSNVTEKRYLLNLLVNFIAILKDERNQYIQVMNSRLYNIASRVLMPSSCVESYFKDEVSVEMLNLVSDKYKLSKKALIMRLFEERKISEAEKRQWLETFTDNQNKNLPKKSTKRGGLKFEKAFGQVYPEASINLLLSTYPTKREFCAKVFKESSKKRSKEYLIIKDLYE